MGVDTVAADQTCWLDTAFLQTVFDKEETAGEIQDMTVEPAVDKGDNYLSNLLRVGVTFKQGDIKRQSLIIKSMPIGEVPRMIVKALECFEREIHAYRVTLPGMGALCQGDALDKAPWSFTAKCYHSPRPDTLVLEDLNALGYRMVVRQDRLDFEHCSLVLKALARLHGLSVALHVKDPTSMDTFSDGGLFSEKNRDAVKMILEPNMTALANVVQTWENYEHFGEKLRHFAVTSVDRVSELVKQNDDSFRVLNHGDCWGNNVLFRYSAVTGDVEDVKLVDLQLCHYASPALDLLYFFYISPNEETFAELPRLLEVYHGELCETLGSVGCDPHMYSLQQLRQDMESRLYFAVFSVCTDLCTVLSDSREVPDLDNLTEQEIQDPGQNPWTKMVSGQLFRQVFQKFLLHFQEKGLL